MAFLPPVFIPDRYASRYSLLGAFARELGAAFAAAGFSVNPEKFTAGPRLCLFLNFPEKQEEFLAWARPDVPAPALVQLFVDHPFALSTPRIDALAALPGYRLLMPCVDESHLLRLRWPTLVHAHCPHGVDASALAPEGSIKPGREIDLLIAGSIHAQDQLAQLKSPIPAQLHAACDQMVEMMATRPHTAFGQACELSLPAGAFSPDHWGMLAALWRYVTAAVNRNRRVALARAMQGVKTTIIGVPAWEEVCEGTLRYAGEVPYEQLPGWFARAKTCLAWGPTQFRHSFSERLLLAMAGACASVSDDRLLVRRHFAHEGDAAVLDLFDAGEPQIAREKIESLLRDNDRRVVMGRNARACVEKSHLWKHRVPFIMNVASGAWK